VLYLAATGEVPFPGSTGSGVLRALRAGPPQPAHERRPEVPGWLGRVIARLLEREPGRRFATAAAAAAALDRAGE
jgi:hypothetical protein